MGLAFPPIFLLPVHLSPEQIQELKQSIPTLTCNIREADFILGNITQRKRALFELRKRRILTEPFESALGMAVPHQDLDHESMETQKVAYQDKDIDPRHENLIKVVKLTWYIDSLRKHELLPLDDYLVYAGRPIPSYAVQISDRFVAEGSRSQPTGCNTGWEFERGDFHPPPVRQPTSEHDRTDRPSAILNVMMPSFSCQRRTPNKTPNKAFIDQLKQIREKRMLLGDHIGVRAYSTSIATLAAYPHHVANPSGKPI